MRLSRFLLPLTLACAFVLMIGVSLYSRAAQTTCSQAPRLTIGQRAQVLGTQPNNLREKPARDADIIDSIPGGSLFTVVAGPECEPGNDIQWWQITYNGQVGWTAEGDTRIYYIEPVNPSLLYRTDELVVGAGQEGRGDLALYDVATAENRILSTQIPSQISSDQLVRLGAFTWTPRGEKIAFTVEIYEPFIKTIDQSVYLMNADGSGTCLLAENAAINDLGVFAIGPAEPTEADGAPLAFPVCEDPPAFVEVGWRFTIEPISIAVAINQTTGERIQLTDRTLGDALYGSQISPDERMVAFVVSDINYRRSLYLSPLVNPQAQLVQLNGDATTSLDWSPDSQSLLVAAKQSGSGEMSLIRIEVSTGQQTVIYRGEHSGYELNSPAWSPSGGQIAFSTGVMVSASAQGSEPHLFLMNADGSNLRLLDTPPTLGPILWRPE